MAGINAVLKTQGKEPFVMKRSEGYIGVMIDDLVTKGTSEPYRLLTSRAEYRLLLRHDNADLRLTELGYKLGLATKDRYEALLIKKEQIEQEMNRLSQIRLKPTEDIQAFLAGKNISPLRDGILALDFLRRPEISYWDILEFAPLDETWPRDVEEQIEIQVKYEGYIKKAIQKVDKLKRMENKRIPENIDYSAINGIATEAKQRLTLIQPETIAQASRISGVNPADISVLMVYVEQGKIVKV